MNQTHYERQMARISTYLPRVRKTARQHVRESDGTYPHWKILDLLFQEHVLNTVRRGQTTDESARCDFACIYAVCELIAEKYGRDTYQFFGCPELRSIEAWTLRTHNELSGRHPTDLTHLGDTRVILMKAAMMIAHQTAGTHVFKPTPGLAQQLKHTELRGLSAEDIKLPYSALYIEVPLEAGITLKRHGREREPVVGLYVTHADASENPGVYGVDEEMGTKGLDFLVVGEGGGDHDDTLCRFAIPLPAGRKLDDILDWLTAHFQKRSNESYELGFGGMIDLWLDIFRWALNVLIYASWPDAEHEVIIGNPEARALWNRRAKTKKTSKRAKITKQLRGMPLMERRILGKSVTILDRGTPASEGGEGSGKPLTVRTLVSGHWRRYHVGEGRKRVERRWIAPFWRGPQDAPVNNPTHELR